MQVASNGFLKEAKDKYANAMQLHILNDNASSLQLFAKLMVLTISWTEVLSFLNILTTGEMHTILIMEELKNGHMAKLCSQKSDVPKKACETLANIFFFQPNLVIQL